MVNIEENRSTEVILVYKNTKPITMGTPPVSSRVWGRHMIAGVFIGLPALVSQLVAKFTLFFENSDSFGKPGYGLA